LADLLGQGGAGQVWRAEDLELGRSVAVKLLQRSDVTSGDGFTAIRAEARKAARLVHPNVVGVYDVVVGDDGRAFLVMELVDGPNLAEVLRTPGQGQASSADVADIAVQTARALDAAHAAGVLHCDIKPANLLLAPDGTVKVTDFGIAATSVTASASPGSGQTGVFLGTASYVSPEQVRGQPATPASDWYSLGCVLYELLTGRPPFVAETTEEVLGQHIHAAPIPIQVVRPDVNVDLVRH
jgi:serine/threonine-protein kinase